MVRSYTPVDGCATPTRRTLDVATLLIADPKQALPPLGRYPHRVMQLCLGGSLSVAEVSAYLELPGAVTKVIVAQLVDAGYLISRRPIPPSEHHSPLLLEKVLNGLKNL